MAAGSGLRCSRKGSAGEAPPPSPSRTASVTSRLAFSRSPRRRRRCPSAPTASSAFLRARRRCVAASGPCPLPSSVWQWSRVGDRCRGCQRRRVGGGCGRRVRLPGRRVGSKRTRRGTNRRSKARSSGDDDAQTFSTGRGAVRLSGGSDGDRLLEIDAVLPPCVPFLYPEGAVDKRRRRGAGRYAAGVKGSRIPEELWPAIVVRARQESLRSIALDLGVSHETVRSILRTSDRVTQSV